MGRYLLFKGDDYYPLGGWGDFEGSFDTIKEAQEAFKLDITDWANIVDVSMMKEVSRYEHETDRYPSQWRRDGDSRGPKKDSWLENEKKWDARRNISKVGHLGVREYI